MLKDFIINQFIMKKLLYGAGSLLFFVSCSSQSGLSSDQIDGLLQTKNFSFNAQRVQPLDASVNQVMANLPGGGAARLYNLSYGYGIDLKDDSLSVNLPYFGRTYRPNFADRDGGIKLETKAFEYSVTPAKRGYRVVITPSNRQEIQNIYMDISSNGSTSVSLDLTNKTAISYTGYISSVSTRSK